MKTKGVLKLLIITTLLSTLFTMLTFAAVDADNKAKVIKQDKFHAVGPTDPRGKETQAETTGEVLAGTQLETRSAENKEESKTVEKEDNIKELDTKDLNETDESDDEDALEEDSADLEDNLDWKEVYKCKTYASYIAENEQGVFTKVKSREGELLELSDFMELEDLITTVEDYYKSSKQLNADYVNLLTVAYDNKLIPFTADKLGVNLYIPAHLVAPEAVLLRYNHDETFIKDDARMMITPRVTYNLPKFGSVYVNPIEKAKDSDGVEKSAKADTIKYKITDDEDKGKKIYNQVSIVRDLSPEKVDFKDFTDLEAYIIYKEKNYYVELITYKDGTQKEHKYYTLDDVIEVKETELFSKTSSKE